MNRSLDGLLGAALGAVFSACLMTAGAPALAGGAAPRAMSGEELYAEAANHFRHGRFPQAYGRFIALADAGHAPSARMALMMCEHGPTLFGRDWDCAPQQVEAWAAAAGVVAPRIVSPAYGATVRSTAPSQGARR